MRHIQQYLRCYTEPILKVRPDRNEGEGDTQLTEQRKPATAHVETREAGTIQEIGAPYEGWCLPLDIETTTDDAQVPRFGIYEIHGINRDARIRGARKGTLDRAALDTLHDRGIFYNPDVLTKDEITTIARWAEEQRLRCVTMADFVRTVFYPWVYIYRALCIGHNLAFDLSRLATRWGTIDRDDFNGGFWFTLCDCGHDECFDHPPIRIKRLGNPKHRYDFRAITVPPKADDTGKRKGKTKTRNYRGRFLDSMPMGRALLGPGKLNLRGLGKRAGVPNEHLKEDWGDEHGQSITPEYLEYAARDVHATWALYQALRGLYRQHNVSRSIWLIYSEASLGKAYYHDLGVPRFRQQHPDFPKELIGHTMEAYYGGRSEVDYRLKPVEVIHTDFKSQYPTVNALMSLQELLLAERIEIRESTDRIRRWLARLIIDDLQRPETWQRFRVLVRLKPNSDLLPVRTTFGGGAAATNIALAYLYGRMETWYTLPDAVNSVIHTGRVPEIVEAIELVPVGQVETTPIDLFGDDRYRVDLSRHDLFTAVIDLRTRVQADYTRAESERERYMPGSPGWKTCSAEMERLDSLQRALKLLASSTSYGVLVEVNQDERTAEKKPVMCYEKTAHRILTDVVESPGSYFAGPIGTFIPAGGRLLLGIAEKLAADRGIGIALCDTDSLMFARPEGMSRQRFRRHVREITDWLTPLSPYAERPPILEMEDDNQWQGSSEPLYALAISAKRYVLYNRCDDGTFRIRKFSSHGTGMWRVPKGYAPRSDIPEPCERDDEDKADTYKLGGAHWLYDLWYHAIEQAEGGRERIFLDDADWLNELAETQVTITTKHLYEQFKRHFPNPRPFSFILMLPALDSTDIHFRKLREQFDNDGWPVSNGNSAKYDGLAGVGFYRSPEGIRRIDTHEVVSIEHKTLRECLRDYFTHPESKAANPRGIGRLERQHLVAVEHVAIGKETNQVLVEIDDESEGVLPHPDAQQYGSSGLGEAVKAHGVSAVMSALLAMNVNPIPRSTLQDITTRTRVKPSVARTILKALDACKPIKGCCQRCPKTYRRGSE